MLRIFRDNQQAHYHWRSSLSRDCLHLSHVHEFKRFEVHPSKHQKTKSNCYVHAVYYPATNLLLEKGEQLVDYGSNMPDVWANGKPLSQELTIIVEIFNHLKTGCVSFPSKTICFTAQRDHYQPWPAGNGDQTSAFRLVISSHVANESARDVACSHVLVRNSLETFHTGTCIPTAAVHTWHVDVQHSKSIVVVNGVQCPDEVC